MDAAQQSMADALRTSFRILKLAMIVLIVCYFASGIFTVEQNKQALVVHLGRTDGEIHNPGVHWAFPAPIDQVVEIPVRQSATVSIDSHWLHLSAEEKNRPLSSIVRGGTGLHPVRDGALLTGDKGLVHIKWQLTYRVEDLLNYVQAVADEDYTRVQSSRAEAIIRKLLERAAIDIAGGLTTEEAIRKRLADFRESVKRQVNEGLARLNTGIVLESVEIPMSTPPLQTKLAFDQVLRAENRKQTSIREAEQMATTLLNETAGAAHVRMIDVLDRHDAAVAGGDDDETRSLFAELNRITEFEASGSVGSMIRAAKGYDSSVVQGMKADAEQYEALLGEWRDRPGLLKTRMWEQAKQRVLNRLGITKLYRPPGSQFRIQVGPDPRQREREERLQYLQQSGVEGGHDHVPYEQKFPEGRPG